MTHALCRGNLFLGVLPAILRFEAHAMFLNLTMIGSLATSLLAPMLVCKTTDSLRNLQNLALLVD